MKWNVYYHNSNSRKIETYNIFKHGSFIKYVKDHVKNCKTKEEFVKELQSELRYYFWSKCEWEILISPWIGDVEKETIKIDVYNQVMLNFEIFADYVWSNREELLKAEF